MWAVAISCDDLQPLDGLVVSYDVVQEVGPVFLDPGKYLRQNPHKSLNKTHQGSSYGVSFAAAVAFDDAPMAMVDGEEEACCLRLLTRPTRKIGRARLHTTPMSFAQFLQNATCRSCWRALLKEESLLFRWDLICWNTSV